MFSHSVMSDTATSWTAAHQASLFFTISWRLLNSCPLRQWCHSRIISSSVVPFSSCLQYFPASRSFPMSWLFTSGGQSTGASASALPMNTECWFPLGLTGLISLQSVNSSSSQKTLGIQIIHTYCLYVYFKYFPDRSRPRYFLWHFKELYHFYVLKFLIHLLIFC